MTRPGARAPAAGPARGGHGRLGAPRPRPTVSGPGPTACAPRASRLAPAASRARASRAVRSASLPRPRQAEARPPSRRTLMRFRTPLFSSVCTSRSRSSVSSSATTAAVVAAILVLQDNHPSRANGQRRPRAPLPASERAVATPPLTPGGDLSGWGLRAS